MKSSLLGALEEAIDKWFEGAIDTGGLPDETWWPEGLAEKMAKAGEIVFDAIVESQKFAKEQDEIQNGQPEQA
jgi:hypothetical protein